MKDYMCKVAEEIGRFREIPEIYSITKLKEFSDCSVLNKYMVQHYSE
jgi:hypothetical protein